MVKTVVKKEGATQSCGKCGTELICKMKDYGGNFPPTLQWQNYDGAPHFKTSDGKNYACNVPEKVEEGESLQTRIIPTTEAAPPPGLSQQAPIPSSVNLSIINSLDEIQLKLLRLDEMIQAIFRHTIDEQLKKN